MFPITVTGIILPMQFLLRWAHNGATALSTVLLTATILLWLRSYWISDNVICRDSVAEKGDWTWKTTKEAKVGVGGIGYTQRGRVETPDMIRRMPAYMQFLDERPDGIQYNALRPSYPDFRFSASGDDPHFGFKLRARMRPISHEFEVVAPFWCVLIPFTILPALWALQRHRLQRRIRGGLCPRCGYDLRATPEKCPECGIVPKIRRARNEARSGIVSRMLRWAFNTTAAVSMMLCLAAGLLWIRSSSRIDGFTHEGPSGLTELFSARGSVWFGGINGHYNWPSAFRWFADDEQHARSSLLYRLCSDRRNRAGFAFYWWDSPAITIYAVPFWALCSVFFVTPMAKVYGVFRRRRDLRATLARCHFQTG